MTKKYFIILIGFLGTKLFAQRETDLNLQGFEERRFNWGYYIGVGSWDFKLSPKTGLGTSINNTNIEVKSNTGLSVGIAGMMNINNNLDVRTEPSLHFVSRKLTFNNTALVNGPEERNIKSTYLELPLLLHFRGNRWNNVRPFIAGGVAYMRNLQSKESSKDDNASEIFRMTTNNYNWQAEGGIEIYFRHFKFTPSVKGIFMLNNEIVADNDDTLPYYANAIDLLKTRAIMVSLKFE